MDEYVLETTNVEETLALGDLLGKYLRKGTILNVEGELGAGKTHLAKGLAQGLGIKEVVVSPTFIIYQTYEEGPKVLHHIDAYRLKNLEEAYEIGLEEAFRGDGLTFVEWGEHLRPLFDGEVLEIKLEKTGEEQRRITIRGDLKDYEDIFRNRE